MILRFERLRLVSSLEAPRSFSSYVRENSLPKGAPQRLLTCRDSFTKCPCEENWVKALSKIGLNLT